MGGYGFSAVLIIDSVSNLVGLGHFGQNGYGFCTLALIWVCF